MNIFNNKSFELLLWAISPALVSIFLLLIYSVPKYIWGINYVIPVLPLFPVFYWSRILPSEIPYWFVFCIGFLTDIISGTPLGLYSLLCLLFVVTVHMKSKYMYKSGFIIVWGYFSMFTAIFSLCAWLLISLLEGYVFSIVPTLIQFLITICLYPVFHKIFDILAEHIKQRRLILSYA